MHEDAAILPVGRNWRILRRLGNGGEGVVYLVEDHDTACKLTVKIFHSPQPKTQFPGLLLYAANVTDGRLGLPRIELLQNETQLLGIAHEYRHLYLPRPRLFGSFESVAPALVGGFCRMQARLLSSGIALWDTSPQNLLLDEDGNVHWADFGAGIIPAHDPVALDLGMVGYAFARLLLFVHRRLIETEVLPSKGYSFTAPCRYCMDPRLDALALRHRWLRQVLVEVRRQPAAALLDPDCYRRLAAFLPERVALPRAVVLVSRLLLPVDRLRTLAQGAVRGGDQCQP